MTTVGALKLQLAKFPDDTPLEFWNTTGAAELIVSANSYGESVRFPRQQVVEILLKPKETK